MDLQTLREEVRSRIHEVTADFYGTDEVDRALNEGVIRFNSEARWPWLYTEGSFSLAADDDTYDLPDNVAFNRFFNLSISGDSLGYTQELERLDPAAGFRMRHAWVTGVNGRPVYYYVTSALTDVDSDTQVVYTIKFVPAADGDYDFEYQYVRPSLTLAGDTDQPDLPPEYHEAVASWATGHLFLKELQISQKADEQFGLYMKVLEQARQEVMVPSSDRVVAWGRTQPGENYLHDVDVRRRIPPTLG